MVAISKLALWRKVRPVRHCMHSSEVEYKDVLNRLTVKNSILEQFNSVYCCVVYTAQVLTTVPGYPAAVRVWNRTGQSTPGCYLESRGTCRVRGRVRTGPRFHFTVLTTLAPSKYMHSDCIASWSIHEICILMPYFISDAQICDQINIHWITAK